LPQGSIVEQIMQTLDVAMNQRALVLHRQLCNQLD
jgi:hypothetical protein